MKVIPLTVCCLVVLSSSWLRSEDAPAPPPVTKEHTWLKQFVGQWETNLEATVPGQPAMKCAGTISSRALGNFWVVNEMKSDMMGFSMVGMQTVGYDPKSKKFVGTWVDSMSDHLWKYEGTVDTTGKTLHLDADGPSFSGDGKLAKYRDSYEFKSADEIVMTSSVQDPDGKWVTFMTGTAKRKK